MGCVASFNKHCDVCICLILTTGKQKMIKILLFIKRELNKTLEQLNRDVKYHHESEQLKELNEIYQKLLSLDSQRNNDIYDENDNNNLNQINV